MKHSTYTITGSDAVRLAERDQLTLRCYANPIEDGDGGVVTVGVGLQIACYDESLVYVTGTPCGWWDGERMLSEMPGYNVADYFTPDGMYLGPDDDGVEPRWNDGEAE